MLLDLLNVGFFVWGEDENIIQVDEDNWSSMFRRTLFKRAWKTAFVMPNDITKYSECLRGVFKAFIHSSPSLSSANGMHFLGKP